MQDTENWGTDSAMGCILTVDLGGSKVSVGVLSEEGSLLGEFRSEGGNPYVIGMEQARQIVVQALLNAAARTGFSPEQVAVVVGNVFVSSTDDSFLRRIFPRAQIRLLSEPFLNIMLSLRGRPGYTVHSGTGSYVTWFDGERIVCYGGFGRVFGDRGSGYEIGREGLLAAVAAEEGGPETMLTGLLCEQVGARPEDGFLARVRKMIWPTNRDSRGATAYFGSIAPLVSRAAGAGDAVAAAILRRSARELAEYCQLLIEKCGCPAQGYYGTSGGVFTARHPEETAEAGANNTSGAPAGGNLMLEYLMEELGKRYPALEYLSNDMALWQACYECYRSDLNDPCRTYDYVLQYGPGKRC